MNKFLLVILLSLPCFVNAQLEPTEEDMKKYSFLMGEIEGMKTPSEKLVKTLDSLYAADPGSLFLTMILGEVNARLIYDSLRTERISQQLVIIKKISGLDNNGEMGGHLLFTTMQFQRLAGDYQAAEASANELLLHPDTSYRDDALANLLLIYTANNQHAKALETLKKEKFQTPRPRWHGLIAEVFYNNNLYDTALYHVNYAIENNTGEKAFSDYYLKARILLKKREKAQACESLRLAENGEEANAVAMLKQRDQNNRYIKELLQEIEDMRALLKDCN